MECKFYRSTQENILSQIEEWKVNGKWIKFKIASEIPNLPKDASRVHSTVLEDHLEELWYSPSQKQYYRHAGGGRGFYWNQMLEPVGG